RAHVAAPFFLGEPPGEIGVIEIADRQRDAERRQDAAEHDVARHADHAETQPCQHDDVEHHIGEKAEKPVPVPRHPQPDLRTPRSLYAHDFSPWRFGCYPRSLPGAGYRFANDASTGRSCSDFATQPKIPPCALIIAMPTRWNSGKYDATQSSSTRQS